MSTGATLRAARHRAGLSQAVVAERADLTVPVLSAYENDRREPAARTFLRVLGVMGVAPTWRDLPDPVASGERLEQVLSLAEALPYRPRPLTRPDVPWIS